MTAAVMNAKPEQVKWWKTRGENAKYATLLLMKSSFEVECHGAIYAADGSRISGPSLRGMDSLEASVQNGQLIVQFQYFRQLVSDKEVIG